MTNQLHFATLRIVLLRSARLQLSSCFVGEVFCKDDRTGVILVVRAKLKRFVDF